MSDPLNPVGLAFVPTPCGSHTATGVPDLANGRLLVYNNPSSGVAACRGVDIIEVPLADPAAASYLRFELSGLGTGLDNVVTIDPPSSAAGTYQATGAAFGPAPTAAGIAGDVVLVNDGTALPTQGCSPLVGFPAGAIALVDRGTCSFVQKVSNAQAAGATAVIVGNNVAGDPILMGGEDPTIVIPSVMVSLADATTIKAGLPATGRVSTNPVTPARACHDTGVILGEAMPSMFSHRRPGSGNAGRCRGDRATRGDQRSGMTSRACSRNEDARRSQTWSARPMRRTLAAICARLNASRSPSSSPLPHALADATPGERGKSRARRPSWRGRVAIA